MSTREIIDALIKHMEKEVEISGRGVAEIQAYATLVLARQALNRS